MENTCGAGKAPQVQQPGGEVRDAKYIKTGNQTISDTLK
jgi:hypothetical protein